MSTILVTGASGFVARSLITEIKASGNRVVGVSRVPSVSEADEFFSVQILQLMVYGKGPWNLVT